MYRAAQLEDQMSLDSRLAALAGAVLGFAEHDANSSRNPATGIHINTSSTLGTRYHYQVWSTSGKLLLRSYGASDTTPLRPLQERGFSTITRDGEAFRAYSYVDRNDAMIVQVAELMKERESEVELISAYFLALLLLPLMLIVVSTRWLLNISLRSVERHACQLTRRGPLDLAPLDPKDAPAELLPMIISINSLVQRVDRALSVEREFTTIAAHEMRTPLAGLRAHAQLAVRASSPEEFAQSMCAMLQGIDQATYLLDQMLDLARSDTLLSQRDGPFMASSLQAIYQRIMSDLGPIAAERKLSIRTQFVVTQLHADEQSMHLLMNNLLGNAVRYTPPGGQVRLSTDAGRRFVTLTVDDSGPGIPEARRAEAFERFNRLGLGDTRGVGLGLSIVQSVAQAHDAVVRMLDSPLGGLRVEVRFPLLSIA
jgi:two-component system OmpR family sensor kinase/two-component system sensor histidine kinase QseC